MAEDAAKLVIVLEAQSKRLQNQLVAVTKQIDRFAAQSERRFDQMQKKNAASFDKLGVSMKGSLSGLNSVLAPLIGAVGIREVIRYSDTWTEAGNKIAAAAEVSGQFARPLDQIKDAANGARTDLSDYVDLYARLLRISPAIAASEQDVAKATDIVAKSLKAGGASAQEQQAALIQLGQALGSGVLQGDELRSLRENAPLVAKAIADEFGVTIGELKQLGAEGKLTSDRVFKALLASADDIEGAFDATRSTIHDAFTRISNEFTAYIGNAGEASGATQGLIDALNYLADNFADVADVVAQFATLLAGALAGKAIAGVVVGIGEAIGALGAFIVALRGGTLAAGAFTAALGPIGIIAGIAAAAVVLLQQAQDEGKRAAEKHAAALKTNADAIGLAKGASADYQKSLRDQIAIQTEAARAALTEADAQTRAARAKAAASTLSVFGLKLTNPFDQNAANVATANSVALDGQLQDLEAQLAKVDAILRNSPGSKTNPSGAGSGKDDAYDKALKSVQERTASLKAETAAQASLNPLVNDYGFALAKAKATQDLLNAADEAKLAKTPELLAAIDGAAAAYAQATVEANKLAEAQDKAREKARDWFDLGRDVTRGFIDDLIEGKSAAEALGNVLDKLGDKLIDMGLDALFGTGGQDFGLIGKALGFADGGVFANGRSQPLKKFASGGVSRSAAIFGEAGPEAAVPLPDGRRIPVDLRMPTAGASVGLSVSVPISVDARGADPEAISRLQATVAQMKAELPAQVVKAVRGARKTGNL